MLQFFCSTVLFLVLSGQLFNYHNIGFQAKKRKLGLVEDDDTNKLADMASGEQNFIEDKGNNDSTKNVKIRGMSYSILCFFMGDCERKWL